ncbi:MAG: hypothetical protein IKR11_03805 [Solobacterium sp.]|nr:hypothetical protein [Solobacterium sp.]
MIAERMWDKVFQFKKEKMWEFFNETDIFAIDLPSGGIGYCCIMGQLGEHISLALYRGEEGLKTYRSIMDNPDVEDHERMIIAMGQICLQCSFENREDTNEMQLPELQAYAKKKGIQLKGEKAYPNLQRYSFLRVPWPVTDAESKDLEEALDAALYLASILKKDKYSVRKMEEIGFKGEDVLTESRIPYLQRTDEGWNNSTICLPERDYSSLYYEPKLPSPYKIQELKEKRAMEQDDLEAGFRILPAWVEEGTPEDPAHYFPLSIFALNRSSELLLPPAMMQGTNHEAFDALLSSFCDILLQVGKPQTIYVDSLRLAVFLEDFCDEVGIEIETEEYLDRLDEAYEEMENDFRDPAGLLEESGLIDELIEMSDEEFMMLPEEIKMLLQNDDVADVLPEEVRRKIRKLFN